MAEKSDGAGGDLKGLVASLFVEAHVAADIKAYAAGEARSRMIAGCLRAYGIMLDVMAKEDNMSVNEHGGDEARMARADDLRADIERRLARIRADLEDKSMAREAPAGAD